MEYKRFSSSREQRIVVLSVSLIVNEKLQPQHDRKSLSHESVGRIPKLLEEIKEHRRKPEALIIGRAES